MEFSQEIGIQFACLWFGSLMTLLTPKPILIGSNSRESLSGERVTFSLELGEELDEMKSEVVMGIEMDSWVLSDCMSSSGQETVERSDWILGQSSMKWRRDCCDWVPLSLSSCEEQCTKLELLCEGLRRESEVTSPNSVLVDSSYGICCF